MNVGAVIVCAGKGKRLGTRDKAVLSLANKPLFYHTCKKFSSISKINQIILVLRRNNFAIAKKLIKDPKVLFVQGGKERKDSVYNGICALDKKIKFVLIHDGARPFVSKDSIERVISALKKHRAVVCGVRAYDTVKLIRGNLIKDTVPREKVFLAHTPQGFRRQVIESAYKKTRKKNPYDDSQLVEEQGINVRVVEGSKYNFKITHPEDIDAAEALISNRKENCRFGMGFDVHRFSLRKKALILAGVNIPFSLGLDAVSDGDVALHALSDAICGACGLGDIGDYYPPASAKSKGIKSSTIVKNILSKIRGKFNLVNLDITIVAEKPRLAKFKKQMISSLYELFRINAINVKIKSKEGLDILGGRDAIACFALACVKEA
ncbi:MAG: 2-C-methyl-D-erythritol 4-phosphate cytidylyltransferase [Candidatus Omnitrophota bacterium]